MSDPQAVLEARARMTEVLAPFDLPDALGIMTGALVDALIATGIDPAECRQFIGDTIYEEMTSPRADDLRQFLARRLS